MDSFCKLLIELCNFLNPVLTIIDAVSVMDTSGPVQGRTRPLGWIIGSTEPLACETVCCKLINLNPEETPIIKTARKMGLAYLNSDEIQILGDDFSENVCKDFKLPELIPLRFSLPRVFKSVCKQLLLLSKSAIKKILFLS